MWDFYPFDMTPFIAGFLCASILFGLGIIAGCVYAIVKQNEDELPPDMGVMAWQVPDYPPDDWDKDGTATMVDRDQRVRA